MAFTKQTYRDAAISARNRADRAAEQIRANNNLAPAGKQRLLARLYRQHGAELADLRSQMDGKADAEARRLERSLFGLDDRAGELNALSRRDAENCAAQLSTPQEATELMARALRGGDAILANAVAAHAHSRAQGFIGSAGWGEVIDPWLQERPGAAEKLGDLVDLSRNSTQQMFQDSVIFSPSQPSELSSLQGFEIDRLASEDPNVAGVA